MNEFMKSYGIWDEAGLIEAIKQRMRGYFDRIEDAVSFKGKYVVFEAYALDWLCDESEEPEFWSYLRAKSKYGVDFYGGYYTLDLNTLL
jgi:hypothetical protein